MVILVMTCRSPLQLNVISVARSVTFGRRLLSRVIVSTQLFLAKSLLLKRNVLLVHFINVNILRTLDTCKLKSIRRVPLVKRRNVMTQMGHILIIRVTWKMFFAPLIVMIIVNIVKDVVPFNGVEIIRWKQHVTHTKAQKLRNFGQRLVFVWQENIKISFVIFFAVGTFLILLTKMRRAGRVRVLRIRPT